jgi:periplasmic divalent cation tolerance protein
MAAGTTLGTAQRTAKPTRRRAIVVLVTAGSRKTADTIARALVAERLAACVSVLPGIRSIYRWRGGVADDAEWLLLIKTRRSRFAALAARVHALHPYDVPEVVALEIVEGSVPYLQWLFGETR